MLTSYKQSVSTMDNSGTQESVTEASLLISWTVAKAMKPFEPEE